MKAYAIIDKNGIVKGLYHSKLYNTMSNQFSKGDELYEVILKEPILGTRSYPIRYNAHSHEIVKKVDIVELTDYLAHSKSLNGLLNVLIAYPELRFKYSVLYTCNMLISEYLKNFPDDYEYMVNNCKGEGCLSMFISYPSLKTQMVSKIDGMGIINWINSFPHDLELFYDKIDEDIAYLLISNNILVKDKLKHLIKKECYIQLLTKLYPDDIEYYNKAS